MVSYFIFSALIADYSVCIDDSPMHDIVEIP